MSLITILVDWIGLPNNFVGWIIVDVLGAAAFFWLLEGLMYILWRVSTARYY